MSLTNNIKEKTELKEIGEKLRPEYEKKVFSFIDKEALSYYLLKDEDESYISEYKYESLADLIEELRLLWQDDLLLAYTKQIAMMAVKEKHRITEEGDGQETSIPDYIYSF